MTEKQMMKLKGKRVRFTFRKFKYAIDSEVIEGIADYEEVKVYLNRDNQLKPFIHYDMIIHNEDKMRWVEWNKLNNISNLEVLD